MECACYLLADSASGRIMLHGETASYSSYEIERHNISLQFNNITQWLCYEDFLALEWQVRSIDTEAYFTTYPYENRIHLSTSSRFLSFSFMPHELIELRKMLSRAVRRLHWFETLRMTQN